MSNDPWPVDVDHLEVNEVWWPACYWPRVERIEVDDDSVAESPVPGMSFSEYLGNMGVIEKEGGVAKDGEDAASRLLSRCFRAKATREQVRALASVLEDWADKPGMSIERLERGWDIFMNKKIDMWGVFITPRNVADVFESWLREETTAN